MKERREAVVWRDWRQRVPDLQHMMGGLFLHGERKQHRTAKGCWVVGGGDRERRVRSRSKNPCGWQAHMLKEVVRPRIIEGARKYWVKAFALRLDVSEWVLEGNGTYGARMKKDVEAMHGLVVQEANVFRSKATSEADPTNSTQWKQACSHCNQDIV